MKKYISPVAEFVEIDCNATMATGSQIKIDSTTSGSEQLQNKQQGAWGNLWGK